jgi:hypothetical protein
MRFLYTPLLATIALLCSFSSRAFSQGTIEQLLDNGPNARRINIVFFSEGYTASQAAKYHDDAAAMLNQIMNTEPYREYRSYFNAFAIFVASAESGSDHPSGNVYRDTYFNSSYDSYGIERLVTIPPNDLNGNYSDGRGKVMSLLQKLMPEYDLTVMVVNDDTYGGSGGDVLVTSTHAASGEIVVHEMGHTFAKLGDEYPDAYPGYPDTEEPNTTRQTVRAQLKWRIWSADSIPFPTPQDDPLYGDVVGLFQGAHYHDTGWFRPQLNCKMRSLGVDYCRVCSEAIITSTYGLIHPIDSAFPSASTIALDGTESTMLGVTPLVPTEHSLSIRWLVDGDPVPGAIGPTFNAVGSVLGNGTHTIRVEVIDSTGLVRNDPTSLLVESKEWMVTVAASSVDDAGGSAGPRTITHLESYPNPFESKASIGFSLGRAADVKLVILSPAGRTLATLLSARLAAGEHVATWEADGMAQGVYYYRLNVGGEVRTGKLLLVR